MSHYLKKFDAHSQYLAYIDSSTFIDPNVSICNFEDDIHYTKKKVKGVKIRFMNREINPEANHSEHSVCLAPIIETSYSTMPYIAASQYKFTYIGSSGMVYTANSNRIGGQGGSDRAIWYSDVTGDILWEKIEEYPRFVNKYKRSNTWYEVYTTFWTKAAGYSSYKYNYDQYSIIGDLADLFGTRDIASISAGNYLGMYGHLFDASANNNKDLSSPLYLYEFPDMSSFTSCKEESFSCFFRRQRYASNPVELNITELKSRCFASMFYGCSNFSDLTVHFTEWEPEGTENCTNSWLGNVSATGVFRCPRALPIERGPSRIPEGWDIEYID